MSTDTDPCVSSKNYVYQNCIMKKMMSKIGCHPYFMNIESDFENCSKASELDNFIWHLNQLNMISTEEEIFNKFKCLKPCHYMEYKVYSDKLILINHNI